MSQKEAAFNLLLAIVPMAGAVIFVIVFNIFFEKPMFWGYVSIMISAIGFILFMIAKVSVIRSGILLSFGTKNMKPPMRYLYRFGYLLIVAGVVLTITAAAIMRLKLS